MGEIEIGEYVRTDLGIIYEYTEDEKNDLQMRDFRLCNDREIVKHSKQLIDLVELKDLVCFKNKLQNSLENEKMIIHIFDNDTLEEVKQAIKREEIELLEILTHEQFEQNSYKLGEEDE